MLDLGEFSPEIIIDQFKRSNCLDKTNHLYLYAIVRGDLHMPPGKLAAQAGHAFTDSLCASPSEIISAYRNSELGGSKVCLSAKNQNQILRAYEKCILSNIPCAIVVDQDHVLPPHFDGSPIITALGIGPCTKDEARHITKNFRCV